MPTLVRIDKYRHHKWRVCSIIPKLSDDELEALWRQYNAPSAKPVKQDDLFFGDLIPKKSGGETVEGSAIKRIAPAGTGPMAVVLTLALTSAPVTAMERPAISSAVQRDVIKVQLSCRKGVSICFKRWGTASPKYGQCLRNHGC